jgi:hypothetical protein
VKINGWLQVVVLLIGMTGLVTWVITADNRLHARCDKIQLHCENNKDTIGEARLEIQKELDETQADIKVILKTLELLYPDKVVKAKKLNGNN